LTVWTSTQGAFGVRSQIEDLLKIPVSRIRVIPMEIGGGFGGKNDIYLEPLAALLSKKSGHRPVKLTMSRAEVLQATGPTSGSYIRVKMGADSEGRLTAAEAYLAYEAGAFPGSPVEAGANVIFNPYRLDNVRVDGYDVVVNKPKTAAYRAPGGSNAAFAAETVVDELCEKLGMDPIEFRLLNGVRQGDRKVDGPVYPRIGLLEVLQAAKEHPHYRAPLEGANCGRGVACGYWGNYGGRSSASASINRDGSVSLVEGSVDIGGSRAAMAMQLAEVLEIPVTDVKPLVGDTDSVAYTEGTYGSRTTFATGWAMYELGLALKKQLCERAAELWELTPEEVAYSEGVFTAGTRRMTLKALAKEIDDGRPLMASATVFPETYGPAFACHIVDVEADPDTGKAQILRYTALQDVGKAIHPSYVEGQMQGGAVQGIGWAMNEEYFYDAEGHMLNASFLDYRMPTALDLPMIDTVMVEVPNPGHPFGVRGVGEVPIVPPPGAIANALYRALGVRMTVLPMSPAHVLEALWATRAAEE
jgi:CO/xanthine dehydrogenase Mo-binding subunit